MATFLLHLLNDEELHALLIPILYEFFTLEVDNKEAVIENMMKVDQLYQLSIDFNT
jgi:hypothetical protein